MKLPNADQAVVDTSKLRDYCLNPNHPRGRHKARVFLSSCGMTANHTDLLRKGLLAAVRAQVAILAELDDFGQRFVVEFPIAGPTATTSIPSIWIVRTNEQFPRFVTCHVL